jgi:Rod binding domain-containing protein
MAKITCMLALTPSPSPTAWERGVGAHGGAPPRSIAGEGDKGGEGNPALLRACKEFEAIFVLQLWRAMQRTVPTQSKTLNYTEMFDLQFADHLSRQGRFGLAEQLYEQLSRYLPDTGEKR